MTFETFKKIAKQFRPEITVSQHGNCIHYFDKYGCNNKTTIAVTFNDTQKTYNYSGSYGTILTKLGIDYATEEDIAFYEKRLAEAKQGSIGLFNFGEVDANKVAYYETQLNWLKQLPLLDNKGNVIK